MTIEKEQQNNEVFETSDGLTIENFKRETSNPSRLEEFLAYKLNLLGVKRLFGYKTQKVIGTGDAFDTKTGDFKGQVTLQHYGFQKRKP